MIPCTRLAKVGSCRAGDTGTLPGGFGMSPGEDSTALLGQPVQCCATRSVKKFFLTFRWNPLCFSLGPWWLQTAPLPWRQGRCRRGFLGIWERPPALVTLKVTRCYSRVPAIDNSSVPIRAEGAGWHRRAGRETRDERRAHNSQISLTHFWHF